jgi:hypothetical protein
MQHVRVQNVCSLYNVLHKQAHNFKCALLIAYSYNLRFLKEQHKLLLNLVVMRSAQRAAQ